MKKEFAAQAWEDLFYWANNDPKLLARIIRLIAEIEKHPFTGTGKPEPLKHSRDGAWSRRIDKEHRLIYRVSGRGQDQLLQIAQCRGHYD
jgi:toxin YoeB